jgi:hypothetical protein
MRANNYFIWIRQSRKLSQMHLIIVLSQVRTLPKSPPIGGSVAGIHSQAMHITKGALVGDSTAATQSQGVHTTQGAHVDDSMAVLKNQGAHTTQGAHISDSSAVRKNQGVYMTHGTHIGDSRTSTQSQAMNTTQAAHVGDSTAILQNQSMHTNQGAHVGDSRVVKQGQGMHITQTVHVGDSIATQIKAKLLAWIVYQCLQQRAERRLFVEYPAGTIQNRKLMIFGHFGIQISHVNRVTQRARNATVVPLMVARAPIAPSNSQSVCQSPPPVRRHKDYTSSSSTGHVGE